MGYKTTFLLQVGAGMLVEQLLKPTLQQAPEAIGRWRARNKWKIHFFGLSASNPADSFCCVSVSEIAADPLDMLQSGSLTSLLPLFVVPLRFSKASLSGLSVRPSSTSQEVPVADHWIGSPRKICKQQIVSESGIELLSFQRSGDSMAFYGARTPSAAQTAMADLSQRNALWNELSNCGPAVPGLLAEILG